MRPLTPSDDRGSALVVITILIAGGLVFTLLALVVDLGGLFGERRQAQNAADAAAMALAVRCANDEPECAEDTEARVLAAANAQDGSMSVVEVCGRAGHSWTRAQRLAACGPSSSPSINDCEPALGITNLVRVRTETLTASGADSYRSIFGGATTGQQQALATGACSQATWGVVSSARVALPFLLPICPGNIEEGPFQLQDFYSNDPTQTCGTYTGVTKGWAPGAMYSATQTCETGVTISVGQRIPIQPSTTQLCGDPNVVSDMTTVLTNNMNKENVVPVVGVVECKDPKNPSQPLKSCGAGSFVFTVLGFKAFTLLGFNLHNGPPTGATPSGDWNSSCDKARDCVYGRVGTALTTGNIDPNATDFGVRAVLPIP